MEFLDIEFLTLGNILLLILSFFEIDSLFRDIPLSETIDIVTNKVYGNKRKVNAVHQGLCILLQ